MVHAGCLEFFAGCVGAVGSGRPVLGIELFGFVFYEGLRAHAYD